MFDNFLEYGSLLGVVLVCYAEAVAVNVSKINKTTISIYSAAPIVRSSFAVLFVFITLPAMILLPVYIGLFDGIWSGILSLFILGLIGGTLNAIFLIPRTLGIHIIPASVAVLVGYFLIFKSWP